MYKYPSCKFTYVGKSKSFKDGMIGGSVDTELYKEFIKWLLLLKEIDFSFML